MQSPGISRIVSGSRQRHRRPHPPQWLAFVLVFTHAPEQRTYPALQSLPHVVPSHVACSAAGVGVGHGVHDAPHESVDRLGTHALPHVW
jgi:hypothetical protein